MTRRDGGLGLPHQNHRIILETMDGEFAAIVSVTDLGADASPVIVDGVQDAVLRDYGHLVVEHKTTVKDS